MPEHIVDYFVNINNQLALLEKKYNPKKKNLHFADEAIPKVDKKLFSDLLKLSSKAIEIIKDEQDHYSNKTLYARAMFDFWYNYFLIVSSASIREQKLKNTNDFSQETIFDIIEDLIDISEFSIIVSGDLYKRNHEALYNIILIFYSDSLMKLVNKKKKTIKSKEVRSFLDGTLKMVKEILNSRK